MPRLTREGMAEFLVAFVVYSEVPKRPSCLSYSDPKKVPRGGITGMVSNTKREDFVHITNYHREVDPTA